jgi:hypothetical protein
MTRKRTITAGIIVSLFTVLILLIGNKIQSFSVLLAIVLFYKQLP